MSLSTQKNGDEENGLHQVGESQRENKKEHKDDTDEGGGNEGVRSEGEGSGDSVKNDNPGIFDISKSYDIEKIRTEQREKKALLSSVLDGDCCGYTDGNFH